MKLNTGNILLLPLIFILIFSLGWGQNSSKKIQQNIDRHHTELDSLRIKIQEVVNSLEQKKTAFRSNEEKLKYLDHKIDLTGKLIKSIEREENLMTRQIVKTEAGIEVKENELEHLRGKMVRLMIYLYEYGRPTLLETIMLADNWNEMIYKVKYLDVISKCEEQLVDDISSKLSVLNLEKEKYENELSRKNDLRSEKESEINNLKSDKRERNNLQMQLSQEQANLSTALDMNRQAMSEIENIILKLIDDKKTAEKYELELAQIRGLSNTVDFKTLKGILPWPVQGKVITSFGMQKNTELNTKSNNPGIDVKSTPHSEVRTILDGIITTITYLHGYGSVIIIAHGSGFKSVYANVENIKVSEKEYVSSGAIIGEVPNSFLPEGLGSNFHFEIWNNETQLNPEKWLLKK